MQQISCSNWLFRLLGITRRKKSKNLWLRDGRASRMIAKRGKYWGRSSLKRLLWRQTFKQEILFFSMCYSILFLCIVRVEKELTDLWHKRNSFTIKQCFIFGSFKLLKKFQTHTKEKLSIFFYRHFFNRKGSRISIISAEKKCNVLAFLHRNLYAYLIWIKFLVQHVYA